MSHTPDGVLRRFATRELPVLAGFAGAALLRSAITSSYERRHGVEPPTDPSLDDVDWAQAVLWTSVMAAAGALGRLLARYAAGEAANRARSDSRRRQSAD